MFGLFENSTKSSVHIVTISVVKLVIFSVYNKLLKFIDVSDLF